MPFTYTVTQLKSDVINSLHGTTANRLQGFNAVIQRAASELLLELDPMETKRIVQLASPIFNSVYDYTLPVDLKGTKILDIRPQANRTLNDIYLDIYNQAFSLWKRYTLQPNFTIQFNTGLKTIRINNNLIVAGVQLNSATTIAGEGLWVTSGNASDLQQDNVQFVAGGSALEFNLSTGPGFGALTNSNFTSVDLSGQNDQAQIFFYTYLPTAANFSTIQIKWGTDASNYWTQLLSTTNVGTSFADGWNLLQADWETAQVVGTPDNTNVGYLQIIWNYTGVAQPGVRLNSIYSRLGIISEIEYYSKYLFQNSVTGAFQETITDDSNIINLDTETRNLIYLLTCTYAVQQIQGLDATFFDDQFFQQKYNTALAIYKAQYKSEWQKPKSVYYSWPNASYQKNMGRRWNY